MQNIQERQKKILEIITARRIYSQEELIDALRERGVEATQATLSRDLRALRISKMPGEGYVLATPQLPQNVHAPIGSGILSLEFSGQMAVIKTHSGFAGAIAALIDRQGIPGVMGTLAGDDTLLLILRDRIGHEQILDAMVPILPDIRAHVL